MSTPYPPYPPQQPQYPPQGQYPPQQPAYPPPPAQYPPQPQQYGYAPPAAPGYGQPPQQPPAQPLARGSIDAFYDQPAASGKNLSFDGKPPGTSYTGYVAREITSADIVQQTAMHTKVPLFHPDGTPKYVMIVPLTLAPSAEHPDGRACWYVKTSDRSELERAMSAAGVPLNDGRMPPPESGALITVTYTGDRPIPNMNPQKVKAVTYQRPSSPNGNGHAPAAQPAPPVEYAAAPAPQQQWAPPPPQAAPQAQQWAPPPPPPQPQYAPPPQPDPAAAYQQTTGQAPPPPAPQPQMAMPSDLTAEQMQRLRELTGQA